MDEQRMYMQSCAVIFISLSIVCLSAVEIRIDTSAVVHEIDEHFVSVAIDSGVIRRHWDKGKFNTRSIKVNTLATALSPSYLRIGGTDADFLIFDDGTTAEYQDNHQLPDVKVRNRRDIGLYEGVDKKDITNFTMSAGMFDEINKFSSGVGWDLLFDVNLLLRRNGHWDPTNALKLMKYTADHGYKMAGWELGNESNHFYKLVKFHLEPEQLARDFITFNKTLKNFTEFQTCRVLGPSITQLKNKRTINYFKRFFEADGGKAITSASFHQYYINGRTATLEQFMDPAVMNVLSDEVDIGVSIARSLAPHVHVWLGETSSAWGGGAKGLSDRYVAGFLWLDKLGIAAKGGVDVAIRQSFYGGHYALLDPDTCDPTPDYWLTLLYKRLVGRKVLAVTSPDGTGRLRVYAHCVNAEKSGYKQGAIVVYILNLNGYPVTVTFPDISSMTDYIDMYLLQPPQDLNLTSKTVMLNGDQILKMVDDRTLPKMTPMIRRLPLSMPSQSFGFLIFQDADITVCKM